MQKLTFKHVTSVDSTSKLAMELWRTKELRPPFVVTADQQTHGRGQRGAGWISEAGNFFATLVLPIQWNEKVSSRAGLLPLKAGLITAKVLREKFAVPALLKWPNDLYLNGCKLGGILCELQLDPPLGQATNSSTYSNIQANKQKSSQATDPASLGPLSGCLLVGIGINVAHTPTLQALSHELASPELTVTNYLATALQTLPALPFDACSPDELSQFRHDFLQTWFGTWQELDLEDVLMQFGNVALPAGQPMAVSGSTGGASAATLAESKGIHNKSCNESAAELWLLHRYEQDGRITLARYDNQDHHAEADALRLTYQSHNSASVKLSWLYHAGHRQRMPLVGMDVGNSRIKMRLYRLDDMSSSSMNAGTHYKALNNEPRRSRVVKTYSGSHQNVGEMLVLLQQLKSDLQSYLAEHSSLRISCFPVFSSSVNPAGFEAMRNLMSQQARDELLLLPCLLPKVRLFSNGDYPLDQIGQDRLLMIEAVAGAYQKECRQPYGKSLSVTMIVSAGTATTIDFVSSMGQHLGGIIAPGMNAGIAAMGASGALLPKIHNIHTPENVPQQGVNQGQGFHLGETTKEAMLQGVIQPMVHLIEYWLYADAAKRYLSEKVQKSHVDLPAQAAAMNSEFVIDEIRLLLTGGDAPLIRSYLKEGTVLEDLVTLGIQAQVLGEFLR